MDRALVRKHSERFSDQVLRVRPYQVAKLGIKKNGAYVKVMDFYIYGVRLPERFTSNDVAIRIADGDEVKALISRIGLRQTTLFASASSLKAT